MTPIRAARTCLFAALVLLAFASASFAAPVVAFSPDSMSVTPGGTFRTPAITISNATGVTAVSLNIYVPEDVVISTATSSGNLSSVTPGGGVSGLFFSEWDALNRAIRISCVVSPSDTIEVVRSIQFAASANIKACQMTIDGVLTGGSGAPLFSSLTIAPPHAVVITSLTVSPTTLQSSGTADCNCVAEDNADHTLTYLWSDGNKGGAFSPSATVSNPTYTAPANTGGSAMSVTIQCRVRCTQNTSLTTAQTANIAVLQVPPKSIAITSTPTSGVAMTFIPSADSSSKGSPKNTPVTLSYAQTVTDVQITAPKQDGASAPRWFDHWVLDSVDQPQGQRLVNVSMAGSDHTLVAVYGAYVGDLNTDGHVDKVDAELILAALLGDAATTPAMDVDMSGTVNLNDARWIVAHRL